MCFLDVGALPNRKHDERVLNAQAQSVWWRPPAVASGQGLPMIGKLLGHTQVQTTARYAHLAADPIKQAVESVAASLHSALG